MELLKAKMVPAESQSLPYLETFSKAAEACNFTRAARSLGITQAAVSQRIQVLEKLLDLSLFQRTGGQLTLTKSGRDLYDYAQRILALHLEARRVLTGLRPAIVGDLLLGASTVPGEYFLPTLLPLFQKRYPYIRVKVEVGDSTTTIRLVERGKVHLGLVGRRTNSSFLEFTPLAKDRPVVVVPPKHSLGQRREVSFQQLCRQPLVLREVGSGLRYCFEESLEKAGKSVTDLQVVAEVGSNEAIKEAVLRGLGVAVLSSYAVKAELQSGRLRAVRITGFRCDRDIFIVQDQRRVLPGPAMTFLTFLRSHPMPGARP